jgi:DNA-binding transcriptional MerR regulator
MSTDAELFTIGQLARRTGVTTRTIRFWSDAGLIPPAARSASGYRLYDAEAVARIDLIRTLRELGFGLDAIAAVLSQAGTLTDVAAAHVAALDAEIRTLRLRRAVLSTVARRGAAMNEAQLMKEAQLMHKLATLSARERQRIIDDFVAEVFQGVAPESAATGIARGMRHMPAELPDDPAPKQVDAWIELGELVADESFRRRARAMAVAGATSAGAPPASETSAGAPPAGHGSGQDQRLVVEHAGRALAGGIAPGSAEGKAILDQIVPPDTPPAERASLLATLETFTEARVERYWQLLAVINGWEAPPTVVPAYAWLIAALRADGATAAP